MRRSTLHVVASGLVLAGCSTTAGDPAARRAAAFESIHTGLDAASCRREVDEDDPDETPYLVCPGVQGYTLIVRRVDAGRRSIDVVDPTGRVFPLDYQEYVTRHMTTLSDTAEWRLDPKEGRRSPIALIVGVRAREDDDDPGRVTATYLAVAKITPGEVCVTDRIPDGTEAEAQVRDAADSAPERPCAPARPPLVVDGAAVR